jgi:hypothetical protein
MEADSDRGGSLAAACLLSLLAILGAAALVPLRGTLGPANVALLLTALVVLAGLVGGRLAGGLAGVVAALSFNFFHTKPYLTLRVSDVHDVVTIFLIAAIGVGIGQLGVGRARRRERDDEHINALHGLEGVTALVADGAAPGDVLGAIRHELVTGMGVESVGFSSAPAGLRPVLERDGHLRTMNMVHTGRGFALPAGGVDVPVTIDGVSRGHLVVCGGPLVPMSLEQRRVVVALADQLASSWRTHGDVSPDALAS